jgi:hypothetical protein
MLHELAILPTASLPEARSGEAVPETGLRLGRGWFAREAAAGETFRWASNDAELLDIPDWAQTLDIDIERGPSTDGPVELQLQTDAGETLGSVTIDGRRSVSMTLPVASIRAEGLKLHVVGGGGNVPNDTRTLNFRVFGIRPS